MWEGMVKYRLWCWRSVFASDLGEGCSHYGVGLCSLLGAVWWPLLYLFGFCLLQGCCLIDIYTYLSLFLFMPLPPTSHALHSLCIYWMKTRSERRLAWTIMGEKTIIIWISMYRSRDSKCTQLLRLYTAVLDIWVFTVQPNINLVMDKWWTSSYFVLLYIIYM